MLFASLSVDHAKVCSYGGFPIIRHNQVSNAMLLTEIILCHNFATVATIIATRDISLVDVKDGALV